MKRLALLSILWLVLCLAAAPVQAQSASAEYVAQRWVALNLDELQAQTLARDGKEGVTRLHGCFTVAIANELRGAGVDVGLEAYRNPWPGTQVFYSNDILLLRDAGRLLSIDIIAGKPGTDWTQGEPAWMVHDTGMNAADWRDPVPLGSLPCAMLAGGTEPPPDPKPDPPSTDLGASLAKIIVVLEQIKNQLDAIHQFTWETAEGQHLQTEALKAAIAELQAQVKAGVKIRF